MAVKKGLGRGLSALIPEGDMDFLRSVARGEDTPVKKTASSKGKNAFGSKAVSADSRASGVDDATIEKPLTSSQTILSIEPLGEDNSSPWNEQSTSLLGASEVDGLPVGNSLSNSTIGSGTVSSDEASLGDKSAIVNGTTVEWVDLDSIVPNRFQPRRYFDQAELDDLAESIRLHGILQPVVLRRTEAAGSYELVAGERRWRAARAAGVAQVPAIVRELDDQQALELAIIENVQRHDISAIDTAAAYKRLSLEFKLSQEEIAQRVGKSRSAIANTMRLLDLPDEVRQAIGDGKISEGHGRAILMATGEGARRAILRRIVRDQLSVREAERMAQQSNAVVDTRTGDNTASNGDIPGKVVHTEAELKDISENMTKALGTRLSIRPKGERGSIQIEYSSSDELERIYRLISSLRIRS